MTRHEATVTEKEAGLRLDQAAAALSGLTRSRVSKLIEKGEMTLDGEAARPGRRVAPGQRILWQEEAPAPARALPEDVDFAVVYEDRDLAVIDKPKGLVVHPAPGNASGTLVNGLLYRLDGLSGVGGVLRPGIVHRLDKDTSGLMVVAKNDAAHLSLSRQLAKREMVRVYQCLTEGNFRQDEGEIDAPIGRHPVRRKEMAVVPDGRPAKTYYKVLERFGQVTLVSCRLATGRTHQIRVHMKYIGHPVCGDPVYGTKNARGLASQALHAVELRFFQPTTGEELTFRSPLPGEMQQLIARLRAQERQG